MDMKTGAIYRLTDEEREAQERMLGRPLAPLSDKEAEGMRDQPRRVRKNWMRNKPCPCGSGNKFKRCCWSKYQ